MKKNNGYFLIEIIVGLAVISTILILAIKMFNSSDNVKNGRLKAETLSSFQQVAAQYFVANRTSILAALVSTSANDADVQRNCIIFVPDIAAATDPGVLPGVAGTNGTLAWSSDKKTCAFDASFLGANRIWPNLEITFNDSEMGGNWRYVAIFKLVVTAGVDTIMGTADDVNTSNVEMLVVRMDEDGDLGTSLDTNGYSWQNDKTRTEETIAGRDVLGSIGGVFPVGSVGWCNANKTNTNICGNGWNADLSGFIDNAQLATLRNKLPTN